MKLWQSRKAMQTETPTESSPAPQHKQSRFSHLGIRWRLVGSFAMFVALLLMLLWLLQIVFLESFYKSIKTSSIKNTAEEVAASINDENFYTEVNRLTRQDLICVHIVREDGTPVLTSGNQPSCILHMLLTDQAALLFRQAQENLILFADNIWWHLYNLACVPDISGGRYTVDGKLELLSTGVEIFRLIFGDEPLFYADRLANSCRQMALLYMEKGDTDAALEQIERMADYAVAYDRRPAEAVYGSALINRVTYSA